MATTLPAVRVTRLEAHQGHRASCSCGWHVVRGSRPEADHAATRHRASHATPNPADQIPDDLWPEHTDAR